MRPLILTTALITGWTAPANPSAPPACPERTALHAAAAHLSALWPAQQGTRNGAREARAYYERLAAAHQAVPSATAAAQHMVLACQLLSALDAPLTELRTAHAARQRRGRPSSDTLQRTEALHVALLAYERVLREAAGPESEREATSAGDRIAEGVRWGESAHATQATQSTH